MTNHEIPNFDPTEEVEELTYEERLEQVRATSIDILQSRPTTIGRDLMGEVVMTEWPVSNTRWGVVRCALSTPTDTRRNEFFRVIAMLDSDKSAGRNVYSYGESTHFSASARIPLGEGLGRLDELEMLLRACPFEEDDTVEDVGPENPMISGWQNGSET